MKIRKWYFGTGLFLMLWGLETSLTMHFTDILPLSRYARVEPLVGLLIDLIQIAGIIVLVWKGIVNDISEEKKV